MISEVRAQRCQPVATNSNYGDHARTHGVVRKLSPDALASEEEARCAPSYWTFACGDRQTIGAIVDGGMKCAGGDDPYPARVIDLARGKMMNNTVHPSWFMLARPKGEVLGVYLAEMDEDMATLTDRARAASDMLAV